MIGSLILVYYLCCMLIMFCIVSYLMREQTIIRGKDVLTVIVVMLLSPLVIPIFSVLMGYEYLIAPFLDKAIWGEE